MRWGLIGAVVIAAGLGHYLMSADNPQAKAKGFREHLLAELQSAPMKTRTLLQQSIAACNAEAAGLRLPQPVTDLIAETFLYRAQHPEMGGAEAKRSLLATTKGLQKRADAALASLPVEERDRVVAYFKGDEASAASVVACIDGRMRPPR